MSIEAMKQVVEALFYLRSTARSKSSQIVEAIAQADEAIEVGFKAIEEAEKRQPFGWVKLDELAVHFKSVHCGTIYQGAGEGRAPLYLHPHPKCEPITEERILQIRKSIEPTRSFWDGLIDFTRAVEAEHGVKEES
jgi:hypothetical protein